MQMGPVRRLPSYDNFYNITQKKPLTCPPKLPKTTKEHIQFEDDVPRLSCMQYPHILSYDCQAQYTRQPLGQVLDL